MERRRGRRDNGIDATDFAAVGDLDPRLAEHLLDLLATRGIAAYLQPSMDINPITRSSTVPARPTDRLYADRAHAATARDLLRRLVAEERAGTEPRAPGQQPSGQPPAAPTAPTSSTPTSSTPTSSTPHPSTPDRPAPDPAAGVDATFAGIVAGFDRPVDPTSASWPASEDVPRHPSEPPPSTPEPSPEPSSTAPAPNPPRDARHVTEDSLLDGLDTFGADLPDEAPEQFVPPPPPPLPRLSRQAVLGGLGIVVGLVLVLAPGLSPFDRGDSVWLGFVAILAGAVALILRLRPGTEPDGDQHPDDGARV